MSYTINVALNGKHFFATEERSAITKDSLVRLLQVFEVKFPVNEGYTIMPFFNPDTTYMIQVDTKTGEIKNEYYDK